MPTPQASEFSSIPVHLLHTHTEVVMCGGSPEQGGQAEGPRVGPGSKFGAILTGRATWAEVGGGGGSPTWSVPETDCSTVVSDAGKWAISLSFATVQSPDSVGKG